MRGIRVPMLYKGREKERKLMGVNIEKTDLRVKDDAMRSNGRETGLKRANKKE